MVNVAAVDLENKEMRRFKQAPDRPRNKGGRSALRRCAITKYSMKQHILIINGSARINGNTDILLERFVLGLATTGLSSETVFLRNKEIGDCIGCYQCLNEFTCSRMDDMTELRKAIEISKIIVFASPVYWCGVSGLMKTFIDRLFYYYHQHNRSLLSGKHCIVLAPLNQQNVSNETAPFVEFFERLFLCLGMENLGFHFFSGVMDKGAVLQRPEYLEKAFKIGKSLAQNLNTYR